MAAVAVRRYACQLGPDHTRVLLRPYVPGAALVRSIIARVLDADEDVIEHKLARVLGDFATRHHQLEDILLSHYQLVSTGIADDGALTRARKLLIGAHFSGEYALESAALFNPSMVPHPDQTDVPPGSLRFIMSLRATGEGHVSSIEFRSGLLTAAGAIELQPPTSLVSAPVVAHNPTYHKIPFICKLREMDCDLAVSTRVTDALAERFTLEQLREVLRSLDDGDQPSGPELQHTLSCILWLADSNYEIGFDPQLAINERAIFPVSVNESNGIEDARFVQFIDDDAAPIYYATYTAYNGHTILPQLIATEDFLTFRILTLNGSAVQNKGMALFPRKVDGRYAMLSRQDDENICIMFSDNLHYWADPQVILRPQEPWESVKIGNCGSPIETDAGWLVITHGVGPMRTYCIGAALLALDDPTRVIGRLRAPLLAPQGHEREGYVPNVVYSCGSLLHGANLITPYAMSDRETGIAAIDLEHLLAALTEKGGRDRPLPGTLVAGNKRDPR
jgi:predicted GH43/DUF377 family glycosyl hydrolase